MAKIIYLTKGYHTIMSDEDYEYLNEYKWQAFQNRKDKTWYAVRSTQINYKYFTIRMHVEVIKRKENISIIPNGFVPDHIDRDGLNNQRNNLRLVPKYFNIFNKGLQTNNPSGHSGVRFRESRMKWTAFITITRIQINLYYGDSYEDAEEIREVAENYYKDNFHKMKPSDIIYNLKRLKYHYFRNKEK
jgi:hypothetical protein